MKKIIIIITSLLTILFFKTFIEKDIVLSNSMNDIFKKDDTIYYIKKIFPIELYNIYIFNIGNEKYIKRLLAKENQEILFDGENYYIFLNDLRKEEEFIDKNYKFVIYENKKFIENPHFIKKIKNKISEEKDLSKILNLLKEEKFLMDLIFIDNKKYYYKKIPEGRFYMIGDNTINSFDSKFFDSIQKESIIGRTIYIKTK